MRRREPLGYGNPQKIISAPVLHQDHRRLSGANAIFLGLSGVPPDEEVFKKYMAKRSRRGHIPTLLRDWVTAHWDHRAAALEHVRRWIEENRHLFRAGK